MDIKHDAAATCTIEAAETIYKMGVASVVTDGRYVQLVKEKNKKELL